MLQNRVIRRIFTWTMCIDGYIRPTYFHNYLTYLVRYNSIRSLLLSSSQAVHVCWDPERSTDSDRASLENTRDKGQEDTFCYRLVQSATNTAHSSSDHRMVSVCVYAVCDLFLCQGYGVLAIVVHSASEIILLFRYIWWRIPWQNNAPNL